MKMPEHFFLSFFDKHRCLTATDILLSQIPGKQGTQVYITNNMQQAVLASKKQTKKSKIYLQKTSEESFYIKS